MSNLAELGAALIGVSGGIYAARKSAAAARREQDRKDFAAITSAQDKRIEQLEHRLDREAVWRRGAVRYIRELLTVIREQGATPPAPPAELEVDMPI